MLQIAVCDDENIMREQILEVLDACPCLMGIQKNIDTFSTGEMLWSQYENDDTYDILLLDIEMPGMNGIELAKKIRQRDKTAIIIYISSYENYVYDVFEVEPFRFLKKPLRQEILKVAMESALAKVNSTNSYFEYRYNKEYGRVKLQDIYFFESNGRVITIYLKDEVKKFYGKLASVEDNLQNSNIPFMRIHQSYLVNFNYVSTINFTKVVIEDGTEIQISEDRRKLIRQQYLQNWGNKHV